MLLSLFLLCVNVKSVESTTERLRMQLASAHEYLGAFKTTFHSCEVTIVHHLTLYPRTTYFGRKTSLFTSPRVVISNMVEYTIHGSLHNLTNSTIVLLLFVYLFMRMESNINKCISFDTKL